MLEEYLVQECELITITKNRWGDFVESSSGSLDCRFREITLAERSVHGEVLDADAQIWLEPASGVAVGNVIRFDGVDYEIDRINKARRLGESEVQFIKCDLKIVNTIAS